MIRLVNSNGVTLQPVPGSSAEIERNSPFFSLGDEWAGEISTPVNFPYSKENEKEFGNPSSFYTKRSKRTEPITLYDGSHYRQRGRLITESASINQNHIHNSELRGYFVFGLSNFFQIIKDKNLRQLSLGGLRRFNWTSDDPDDASGGFWQYIHSTWAGDKDFLVAPIENEEVGEPAADGFYAFRTNNVEAPDYKISFSYTSFWNNLIPQLKLKYVLEQIFTEHGYTVTYDVNDTQWESLFLTSLIPFNWLDTTENPAWPFATNAPKAVIDVYLNEHLPDRTISDFLINLGNRYGWRFLINDETKVCRVKAVRTIRNGTKKDWTSYCAATLDSDYSGGEKVYGFKNEIDGGDTFPRRNELKNKTRLPDVYSFGDLPTASGLNYNQICYTHIDNVFWIVTANDTDEEYYWAAYSDNIFDYEPTGETDSISTTVSTMPTLRRQYTTDTGVQKWGYFPVMKQPGKDFGFRLLFYHGVVPDELENGTFSDGSYPHLSSIWRVPGDAPDKVWSNVYVHDYGNDIKRGIIEYWFKDWLQIISSGEDLKIPMTVPRNELAQFEWDDILLIKNIPFLMKSFTEPMPYKGKIAATLRRIG